MSEHHFETLAEVAEFGTLAMCTECGGLRLVLQGIPLDVNRVALAQLEQLIQQGRQHPLLRVLPPSVTPARPPARPRMARRWRRRFAA